MDLSTIKNTGNWGNSASRLNENFSKVGTEVDKLKYAAYNSKLYASEALLKQAIPSPSVGDWAIVGNAIPGEIYRCDTDGEWTATGQTGGGYGMEVTEKHVTEQYVTEVYNEYTGDIVNNPDDEDLISEEKPEGSKVLKLADKMYNASAFSGLGRVYLRKNISASKNILTQAMVNSAKTRYVIQYDYDLNGLTLNVPEGCTLDFQGGSFSNGKIVGSNTRIEAPLVNIFGTNMAISGNFIAEYGYPEWFDSDLITDKSIVIQKALNYFPTVKMLKSYNISRPIILRQGNTLEGDRYVSNDSYNLIRLSTDFEGDSAIYISGPGVKLRNFGLQGLLTDNEWHNSNPQGVSGISFYNGDSINARFTSLERLRVSHFGVGIDVLNYYGIIDHCSIYYNNIGIRYGITKTGDNYYSGSTPIIGCHIRENAIGCYFGPYVNINNLLFNTFEFNKYHVFNKGNISIDGGYYADSPKVCIGGNGTTSMRDMDIVATVEDRYGESVHIDRYTMIGGCLNGNVNTYNSTIGIDNPLIYNNSTGKYEMAAYSTIFGDGTFRLNSTKLILYRSSAVNLSLINKGRISHSSDIIDNYIINGSFSNPNQVRGTLLDSYNLFGNKEAALFNYDTEFHYEIPKEFIDRPMLLGVVGRLKDYNGFNYGISVRKDTSTFEKVEAGSSFYGSEDSNYYRLDFNEYINKMNYLVVKLKKVRGKITLYYNVGSYTTKPIISSIFLIDTELGHTKFGFLKDLKNILDIGVSTDRPNLTSDDKGFTFYDETLGRPVWFNGTSWVDANGEVV